ncbi:hypothetical protein pgond44_02323 [Psychroflexus gondwanensis ACAM 44]|jgi:hypothetical protein|uniref:GTP-binding protein n=1 Tax=Psychroflexus gondwanensis ACAM 44 TaxID=1189619 RepID=N1X1W7_9FLAO|nr:hypothetical protein [Psychroflexus gondwanensis]EMY82038.1 hypothetical protein pgond44_02323 [Psychroflexus gondwanensis ACAM 44]
MPLSNDIILRPRFKWSVAENPEIVLDRLEQSGKISTDFVVSRVDPHIFIRIPKPKQHFWSPQLHLEIIKNADNGALVHGLFGPNPTVWTMFMFVHFVAAILIIAISIWLYTAVSLGQELLLPLLLLMVLILLWVSLYIMGRLGKRKGTQEMKNLHGFMKNALKDF